MKMKMNKSCNGDIVRITFVDVPETQNNNFCERSTSFSVWVGRKVTWQQQQQRQQQSSSDSDSNKNKTPPF